MYFHTFQVIMSEKKYWVYYNLLRWIENSALLKKIPDKMWNTNVT
jgi:hypothetical protein